jgi:prepilin-type N-terminal cleavage/methylation domain-containing protein
MAMTFSSLVPRSSVASTRGMTLVEMLVALTITLIMMGAVITVFGFIGEQVTDSRSIIETNDRLRSAAHRLREDLGSVTAEMMPPLRPESGSGYFEIIEGPLRGFPIQSGGSFDPGNKATITGDTDDALFFTIRSSGEPFRGKYADTFYESPIAEVAWYLRDGLVQGGVQTYELCRRPMLITTELSGVPFDANFYESYDVSARSGPGARAVANSLGDLTKRENRFARNNSFPYAVDFSNTGAMRRFSTRPGEDVVLTNVLGMDVQVWDPKAPLKRFPNAPNNTTILTPTDPAYRDTSTEEYPSIGAYVDLGMMSDRGTYRNMTGGTFMNMPHNKSRLNPPNVPYFTYDTWSFHYEHDGVSQRLPPPLLDNSNQPIIDAGTNGIDDNANNANTVGIDDVSERETMPPYPLPLRGIRVTLRVYEPSSRQVREVTIAESFVPE